MATAFSAAAIGSRAYRARLVQRSIERTVYRQWYRVDSGYFTLVLALLDHREMSSA
jgi:hypothetical protein